MIAGEELRQSALWDITRQLVGFNTVSSLSNTAAAEYIANYLDGSGYDVQIWRESIDDVEKATVLAWIGPEEPGGLIISGHTDIVPFDGQPGWKTDALTLHADDKKLYGRGVSDMKVFLAQSMLAAKKLQTHQLKRPVVLIFTCDEELAGQGSSRLIKVLPQLFQNRPLPEVALIGEPTDFAIFPAHKGYAVFDIMVHGKGGHSSAPHKGLNAIEQSAAIIRIIQDLNQRFQNNPLPANVQLFPDVPATTLNLGAIHGGLAPNMIAETCHLTVSIRVSPGDDVESIVQDLQQRLRNEVEQAMQQIIAESSVALTNFIAVPPLKSPTDDPFCTLLSKIMHQQADYGAPYATDGGSFQQIGIRSYICGPGSLSEAHQPNESIPIEHVFTGFEKLEQIIDQWCNYSH